VQRLDVEVGQTDERRRRRHETGHESADERREENREQEGRADQLLALQRRRGREDAEEARQGQSESESEEETFARAGPQRSLQRHGEGTDRASAAARLGNTANTRSRSVISKIRLMLGSAHAIRNSPPRRCRRRTAPSITPRVIESMNGVASMSMTT